MNCDVFDTILGASYFETFQSRVYPTQIIENQYCISNELNTACLKFL